MTTDKTNDKNTTRKPETVTNAVGVDKDDPYIYVDGQKDLTDGSGMVTESFEENK